MYYYISFLSELVVVVVLLIQGFGVAEGRPKEDLKNMANAAGQSCGDYTPPGGETLDQVSQIQSAFIILDTIVLLKS